MIIGIVGLGVVGQASSFGFKKLGHKVLEHDIRLGSTIDAVISADVVFISVPTPSLKTGHCDTSIVENVVAELVDRKYPGIIAIRSTVQPGTTERLKQQYPDQTLCFVPEFLRERCAISDFVENNYLLVVGTDSKAVFDRMTECFGSYPKQNIMMTATEAEILKYYHNALGALRVVFANEFFEICKKLGADYSAIKKGVIQSTQLPDIYLDVNEHMRGYSSICWNKDIPAVRSLASDLGLRLLLLSNIEKANEEFAKTPFEGTREY